MKKKLEFDAGVKSRESFMFSRSAPGVSFMYPELREEPNPTQMPSNIFEIGQTLN
jgi:hypothetical protein